MQYIQLQGQDPSEMNIPLSGSYNLFIDGLDGTIKLMDSEGNWYGGGSSYTEIEYQDLFDLWDAGNLLPGSYYLITDYKTCYDQPDYDLDGDAITTGNYKQSESVDPILVFATSNSSLAPDAYQPDYPNDKIKYDISFNQTEVTDSPARGRITERIDEWGNRTDYDHRTVLFRRYTNWYWRDEQDLQDGTIEIIANTGSTGQVIGSTGSNFTSLTTGNVIAVPGIPELFFEIISIVDDTEMYIRGIAVPDTGDGYPFYLARNAGVTYKQNNISVEYQELPTFLFEDETIVSNYIGDVAALREWNENPFILPNNVFGEDVISNRIGNGFRNNTFNSDVEENVIGDYFENNIIYNDEDFTDNQIGNYFGYNFLICDDFNDNVIHDNFENNRIFNNSDFVDNVIGLDFQNNIMFDDFDDNQIGVSFGGNIIYGEFRDNTIGNDFDSNDITDSFNDNRIGNEFRNNTINNGFYDNRIANEFTDNTIGAESGSFELNNIGFQFKSNLIEGQFSSNIIGDYFVANQINDNFSDNNIGKDFFINDIGPGFTNNFILNNFSSNQTGDVFSANRIGNDFINNAVGDEFGYGGGNSRGNVIGNYFTNNGIGEYFYDNNICDNFQFNSIGDYFQFNRVETGIYGVDFTEYWGGINYVTFPTTSGTNGIYTNVTAESTSGTGVNAVFTVGVSGGLVNTVSISTPGKLYREGDTITISGDSFGGGSDLILTVNSLTATPMVYEAYNKTLTRDSDDIIRLVALVSGNWYISEYITQPID